MTEERAAWLRAVLLCGLGYFLVGRLFAVPGAHAHTWRLAAWAVSLVIYATHFRWERVRRRSGPTSLALHVASGVALGAFALALALMMRSIVAQGSVRPNWILALVLFPAATGVPAFLVALVSAMGLSRRAASTE